MPDHLVCWPGRVIIEKTEVLDLRIKFDTSRAQLGAVKWGHLCDSMDQFVTLGFIATRRHVVNCSTDYYRNVVRNNVFNFVLFKVLLLLLLLLLLIKSDLTSTHLCCHQSNPI
jgi:hypothetical protein